MPTHMSEKEQEGFNFIYDWYASQHTTHGLNPTFDQMGDDRNVMDMGSFVRFNKDFNIMGDTRRSRNRVLDKSEILWVFKKHAKY